MWLERFVIVITSLHRDFMVSSWGIYRPTDLGLGHVCGHHRVVLSCCVFIFVRILPAISIFEMRELRAPVEEAWASLKSRRWYRRAVRIAWMRIDETRNLRAAGGI